MRSLRSRAQAESGFSIVEVMVAALLLLVGVIGTLTLVEGATRTVATSKSREGATNLAREVLERSRSLSYGSLSTSSLTSNVRAMPGMGGGTGTWKVSRRGIQYTVAPAVCSLDDPMDGYGARTGGPYCTGVPAAGTADSQPEDFKRVAVTVSWVDGGKTRNASMTAVRSNRSSAEAPTVSSITTTSPVVPDPQNPVITDTATTSATFRIVATSSAQSVQLSLDGTDIGTATPVGNAKDWDFTLNVSQASLPDGTYSLGARAIDALTNAGPTVTIPLTLQRSAPGAPTGITGGRNDVLDNGSVVSVAELDWLPSEERNVVGYRVYRPDNSLACPTSAATIRTDTWCVDVAPQAGTYGVVSLYRDGNNVLQESARGTVAIQAASKIYYFSSSAGTGTQANCGNANWWRQLDDTFTPGAESILPSGNGDVVRFCTDALPATTIAGGDAKVTWYMSNTGGSGCTVTTTLGTGTSTPYSRSFTVPVGATAQPYVHTVAFPSSSLPVNSRLVAGWTRNNGASCSGIRIHHNAAANPSRLELPKSWSPPNAPTGLTATRDTDGVVTLNWTASSTPAASLFGYRVYRDGQDWTDRLGVTGDGTELTFSDANRDGGTHTYYVTAVSTQLGESTQVGPVTG